MFCTQCGSELYDDAVFCTSCGAKIHAQVEQNVQGIPREVFNYQENATMWKDEILLNKLSKRIAIGGVLWILVGISQLISAVGSLFEMGIKKSIVLLVIVGISNILNGFGDLSGKEDIYENRMQIVKENAIKGNIKWYIWNGVVGLVCLLVGDYFFGLLVIAAVVVDLFFIKLYVNRHKKDFIRMGAEQWQKKMEQKTIQCRKCGAECGIERTFCVNCGSLLEGDT